MQDNTEEMLSIINEINHYKEMMGAEFEIDFGVDDYPGEFVTDLSMLQDRMRELLNDELSLLHTQWENRIRQLLESLKNVQLNTE